MVIHQAKGVEQPALLLDLFGQQIDEAQAILIVEKDRLTTIAAGGNVINGTRELEAKWTGHYETLG